MKIKSFLQIGSIVASAILIAKGIDATITKEIIDVIRAGNATGVNTLQLASKTNIVFASSIVKKNIKKIRNTSFKKNNTPDRFIKQI